MKPLFTGLMTYFNAVQTAGSFYAGVSGRLYNTFAPQPTAYPYAVFFLVADMPEHRFGGEVEEYITIQFNIFSDANSGVEVNDLFTKLKARFDNCTLTVSGYRHIEFTRGLSMLIRDEERGVWQYSIEYDVLIEL